MKSESVVTFEPREGLWTVNEVAAFLHMSTSWVNKRAADGTIPVLRIGRVLRFEPQAIKAWMHGKALPAVLSFPSRSR